MCIAPVAAAAVRQGRHDRFHSGFRISGFYKEKQYEAMGRQGMGCRKGVGGGGQNAFARGEMPMALPPSGCKAKESASAQGDCGCFPIW